MLRSSVALPEMTTIYGYAKHLEFNGDLKSAFYYYHEALYSNDRPDSALKDISNIYVMFGRVREAMDFLVAHQAYVTNRRGYMNLIERLSAELERKFEDSLPRAIFVDLPFAFSVEAIIGVVTNVAKIQRVLKVTENSGVLHFASYSAARKALNLKLYRVAVRWAEPEDQKLMNEIEKIELAGQQSFLRQPFPQYLDVFQDAAIATHTVSDTLVIDAALRCMN